MLLNLYLLCMEEMEIGGDFQSFAESLVGVVPTTPESSSLNPTEPKEEPAEPVLTVDDVEKQLAAIINPTPAPVEKQEPKTEPIVTPAKPEEPIVKQEVKQHEWWEKPSSVEKTEPQESVDDWKKKYEELNAKLATVESDELVNLHLKFKDTEGYDFKKLIDSFKTEDKSSASVEDLYEEYLKKSGKDDDVITTELMKLDSKTELEKDSLKADLLSKLTTEKKENPYLELLNENAKKQEEAYSKHIEAVTKAREVANNFATNLVGKEIAGFKIDESVSKTVLSSFDDPNFWKDDQGNYDPIKETMSRLWTIYGPSILKAGIDKARSEVISERTRPSANHAPAASAPPVSDPKTKASSDFDTFIQG
jgi:hypothetical protein